VGGAGHAHGLMQVWKDHYPGLNLFDPDVNISTGMDILRAKLDQQDSLQSALWAYSGGNYWSSHATYLETYWQPFMGYYKEFFGIDIEPAPQPDPIQEALKDLQAARAAIDVAKNRMESAEEKLLGI